MRRKLSEEELIEILGYIRKGMRLKDICEKMDKTPYEVEKATNYCKFNISSLPLAFSEKEINELYNLGYIRRNIEYTDRCNEVSMHQLVKYLRHQAKIKYRKKSEKTLMIESMHINGASIKEIREAVGCSRSFVYRVIHLYEYAKSIE